jgi:chemotaxis protein methyltransferase CheR
MDLRLVCWFLGEERLRLESEYEYFVMEIKKLTGIDLGQYRSQQMRRRLGSLLHRSGVSSFIEYYRLLERDRSALLKFVDSVTINVSEFFRNTDKFSELETRFLPELLSRHTQLKIWSAGCANGAEPYSVAILLDELAPFGGHSILATDIDSSILEKAKLGTYTASDVRNVSRQRLETYFTHDAGTGTYTIKRRIRERVTFETHDLLRDPYPTGLDLILCRNVVIYFTEQAKATLYKQFFDSLRPGGLLFVGGTEMVFGAGSIGYDTVSPFFYQKPASDETKQRSAPATTPRL